MSRPTGSFGFYTLIMGCYLVALLVAVYPLSYQFSVFRPELVCLLTIYWVTQFPLKIGMGFAAFIGLLQDIIEGSIWGGHMLALTIIAYICLLSYQRIKNYSIWHQSFWMFVLVGIHQIVINWVQGLAGYRSDTPDMVFSITISALCWPLLFSCMSRMRYIYRIL